jgi:hypothetical protein
MMSLRVEVSLFVLSPEIEDRDEVEAILLFLILTSDIHAHGRLVIHHSGSG